MKVYTICENQIIEGAIVGAFILSNGTAIPAITVGEEGKGRGLGVLPVQLTLASYRKWAATGNTTISFGSLGKTMTGKPKLIETASSQDDELLIVLPTPFGYRGGNAHFFPPFVEEVVKGRVAESANWRLGGGVQLIVRAPAQLKNFSVRISGRRYGAPHRYTYTVRDGGITLESAD